MVCKFVLSGERYQLFVCLCHIDFRTDFLVVHPGWSLDDWLAGLELIIGSWWKTDLKDWEDKSFLSCCLQKKKLSDFYFFSPRICAPDDPRATGGCESRNRIMKNVIFYVKSESR